MSSHVQNASTNMASLSGAANYRDWAQDFQTACQYRGIWKLFNGEETTSISTVYKQNYERTLLLTKDNEVYNLTERKLAEETRALNAKQQRIESAMAFLAESVHRDLRGIVQGCRLPNVAWTALKTLCGSRTLGQVVLEMKELHQKDCPNLEYYLSKIVNLKSEILEMGGVCTEDMCKIRIITGLMPEYSSRLMQSGYTLEDISKMQYEELTELLVGI